MANDLDSGYATFLAAGAIAIYDRVIISAAKTVSVAGIIDREIGVAYNAAFAAGDPVLVKLTTAPGTVKMRAKAALAVAAEVFTAAVGEVNASASTAHFIGIAITASTAEDDIIEVLRQSSQTAVA